MWRGEGREAEVGEVEGGHWEGGVVGGGGGGVFVGGGGGGLVRRGRGRGGGEGEEDVFGLEVAVRDVVRVQGRDGREELVQECQRVRFGEGAVRADVGV